VDEGRKTSDGKRIVADFFAAFAGQTPLARPYETLRQKTKLPNDLKLISSVQPRAQKN
jgi:hypothetical protein